MHADADLLERLDDAWLVRVALAGLAYADGFTLLTAS